MFHFTRFRERCVSRNWPESLFIVPSEDKIKFKFWWNRGNIEAR